MLLAALTTGNLDSGTFNATSTAGGITYNGTIDSVVSGTLTLSPVGTAGCTLTYAFVVVDANNPAPTFDTMTFVSADTTEASGGSTDNCQPGADSLDSLDVEGCWNMYAIVSDSFGNGALLSLDATSVRARRRARCARVLTARAASRRTAAPHTSALLAVRTKTAPPCCSRTLPTTAPWRR